MLFNAEQLEKYRNDGYTIITCPWLEPLTRDCLAAVAKVRELRPCDETGGAALSGRSSVSRARGGDLRAHRVQDGKALAELGHVFDMIAEEFLERGVPLPEDTTEIVNA